MPRKTLPLKVTVALSAGLLLLAACGGDDDSDGGDDTPPGVTGTMDAPGPDFSESPGASPDFPAECSESESEIGLVSKLDFEQRGGFEQGGQFDQGEEITARMRVINCASTPTTLFFSTTQRYEMTVEDEDGGEIWSASDGESFEDAPGQEPLDPGETITYEETWDQSNRDGEQMPPGLYFVDFQSLGCGTEDANDCHFGPGGYIQILE